MKKQSKIDAVSLIFQFQKRILDHKPSRLAMYREVQMMQYKIRPVQGDVSLVNLSNSKFIEILWSLGKLEEFFHKHERGILVKERPVFYRMLDDMYHSLQDQLNALHLKPELSRTTISFVEMEIVKGSLRNKKTN